MAGRRRHAAAQPPVGAGPGRGALTESRGERELRDIDVVFHALAHQTRRHILQVLQARGGAMTSGQLAGRFAHAWPTVTRHLKELEAAGLVRATAAGRERHYTLDTERLRAVTGLWLQAFDAASPQ